MCTENCVSLINFKGRDGIRKHLEDECPNTQVICGYCEVQCVRDGIDEHDCMAGILDATKRYALMFKEQQFQFESKISI